MTIKVNFKQSNSYNASDLTNQFATLFTDGVCKGLAVTQHSPQNLSVDVSIGSCMKSGYFFNSDTIVNVPITGNASGYNRIDSIVADIDNEVITVIQGTPSASPQPPAITGNKIELAHVSVNNNINAISNSDITKIAPQSGADIVDYLFSTNGYIKWRCGFILQWGLHTVPANNVPETIIYPIPFPNVIFNVLTTAEVSNAGMTSSVAQVGLSTVQLLNADPNLPHIVRWVAIGI